MKTNYRSICEIVDYNGYRHPFDMTDRLDVRDYSLPSNPNLQADFDYDEFKRLLLANAYVPLETKRQVIDCFASLRSDQVAELWRIFLNARTTMRQKFEADPDGLIEDVKRHEIESCRDYLRLVLEQQRRLAPGSQRYDITPAPGIEGVNVVLARDDGRIVLVGHGRDLARLTQIDTSTGEIAADYRLRGRYVVSLAILSAGKAVVGTNSGHVAIINLADGVVLLTKSISGEGDSVRSLAAFAAQGRIVAATEHRLVALDRDTLEILFDRSLAFSPWDVIAVPGTALVSVSGAQNRVLLLQTGETSFVPIDEIECGPSRKDVSSATYNAERQVLITTSESGYLDLFVATPAALTRVKRVEIDDRLYWAKSVGHLVAFSGSKRGVYLYDIAQDRLVNIDDAKTESRPVLQRARGDLVLLFQLRTKAVVVANLSKDDWDFVRFDDLTDLEGDPVVTPNGDIIFVAGGGIFAANLFDAREASVPLSPIPAQGFRAESATFSRDSQSAVVRSVDGSLFIADAIGGETNRLPVPNVDEGWQVRDFRGDSILLTSLSKVAVVSRSGAPLTAIEGGWHATITDARWLDEARFAVLNDAHIAQDVEAVAGVFEANGVLVSETAFGYPFSVGFTESGRIVRSEVREPSRFIDLLTGEEEEFDIGYAHGPGDVVFSRDEAICIHLLGDELTCFALRTDHVLWKVEDPALGPCKLLGFSPRLDGLMVFNRARAELLWISASRGSIKGRHGLSKKTEDVLLSPDGERIFSVTRKGDWQIAEIPFKRPDGAAPAGASWRHLHVRAEHLNNRNSSESDLSGKSAGVSGATSPDSPTVRWDPAPEVHLAQATAADLWQVLQQRFENREFHSMQSPDHQLDPCGFNLSIPNLAALDGYDENLAIAALLGWETDSSGRDEQTDVAVIFHELFHVFQVSATRTVFDYFQLVDRLQSARAELLTYLGKLRFFADAQDATLDYCTSVFHSVARCGNPDLLELSELRTQDMRDLLDYFEVPGDAEIHALELVEGSAEVFGLCCAGLRAFSILDEQIGRRPTSGPMRKDAELYTKAYSLFAKTGGRTPLLLVALSLVALRYGSQGEFGKVTPSTIFTWALDRVQTWESGIAEMLGGRTLDAALFRSIADSTLSSVAAAVRGRFMVASEDALHGLGDDEPASLFVATLGLVRDRVAGSDELAFMSDLILQRGAARELSDVFFSRGPDLTARFRRIRVLQDFEKFLALDSVDSIYCCADHPDVAGNGDWLECDRQDSFRVLLKRVYGVAVPECRLG